MVPEWSRSGPEGKARGAMEEFRTLAALTTGRSETYRTLIAFAVERCAALATGCSQSEVKG